MLNETSSGIFSYILNVVVINSEFNNIEDEKIISTLYTLPYIRLQRIDLSTIIYFISDSSYNISLKNGGISISNKIDKFHNFDSVNGLFFYNNEFLFSSKNNLCILKKEIRNIIYN